MDLTQSTSHYKSKISPDTRTLATIDDNDVSFRDTETMGTTFIISFPRKPQELHWSPNSKFVACQTNNRISVIDISSETVAFIINDVSIAGFGWCKDSRHIFTIAMFQMRMTLWTLGKGFPKIIEYPKYTKKGIEFSEDGKLLAVLVRKHAVDEIQIYDSFSWKLLTKFSPDSVSLSNIRFSPNSRFICTWETCHQRKFTIFDVSGKLVHSEFLDQELGIKDLTWSKCGRFICVTSFDDQITLFNSLNWKPVFCEVVPLIMDDAEAVVYVEKYKITPEGTKHEFQLCETPFKICLDSKTRPDVFKAEFDVSNYLAYCKGNVIWIFDVQQQAFISALVFLNIVTSFDWNEGQLVVATGSSTVYLWNTDGCECVMTDEKVETVQWNGPNLLFTNSNSFSYGYRE